MKIFIATPEGDHRFKVIATESDTSGYTACYFHRTGCPEVTWYLVKHAE